MPPFIRNLISILRHSIIRQQERKLSHNCFTELSATWHLIIQSQLMRTYKSVIRRQPPPIGTFNECHSEFGSVRQNILQNRLSTSFSIMWTSKCLSTKFWSKCDQMCLKCFSLILPSLKREEHSLIFSSCKFVS